MPSDDRRRHARHGFAPIEASVAVALFAILALAAGGMFGVSTHGPRHAGLRTSRATLLQSQVQRIYRTPYTALASGRRDTTLAGGRVVRRSWTVTEIVPRRLKQVELRVQALDEETGGEGSSLNLFVVNREF